MAALALRQQGLKVTVVAPPPTAVASYCSYGGVMGWPALPGSLGAAMVRAPDRWQELERCHGPLGWQPCQLSLYWSEVEAEVALPLAEGLRDQVSGSQLQLGRLILPFGRVDGVVMAQALPQALQRAGVGRIESAVERLTPQVPVGWRLHLAGGDQLEASQVVLAAGPASTTLWPPLADGRPPCLGMSWSGALELEAQGCGQESLRAGAADGIVLPLLGQRQALEARSHQLQQPAWIVDGGLAPRGEGWWLGQISVVGPGGAAQGAPDPIWMEAELRQGLQAVWPQLADLPGRFVQVPVAFPSADAPLVGPIAGAPGLWGWAGFQGAFSLVPVLAPDLASAIAGSL